MRQGALFVIMPELGCGLNKPLPCQFWQINAALPVLAIAQPKPNQSKAKGLVGPIKPILSLFSLSLLLKSAVYSASNQSQSPAKVKQRHW